MVGSGVQYGMFRDTITGASRADAELDNRHLSLYIHRMILAFKHRGLRRLYEDDDGRGLNAEHVAKIRTILAQPDVAERPEDMNTAGLKFML